MQCRLASMHVAEIIERELTPLLGPHTARNAVRTFATRALGHGPEELTREEGVRLVTALRPMLQTLLGQDAARRVTDLLLLRLRP